MMEGLLRILVVALGLLLIWWLCGPIEPARREGSGARADARGRR